MYAHQEVYFCLFFSFMANSSRTFQKPAIDPRKLLKHLKRRGLLVPDESKALHALEYIGYYRLLIYMRPLQQKDKTFQPNAAFDNILNLYGFDRKLRLLCLDAIERIEVALRAALINSLAQNYGPHFYLERRFFEKRSGFKTFLRTATRAFPIQLYTALAFGLDVLMYWHVHSARLASAALFTIEAKTL
jgi:abortive infection bacteriophage resistance protein